MNEPFSFQCPIFKPPENVRKPKISDVYGGCQNRALAWKGLMIIKIFVIIFYGIPLISLCRNDDNKFAHFRSSGLDLFRKKGVLKHFAKFTEKRLYQGLSLQLYLKKRPWHRCFLVNFATFLRKLFYRTPPVDASYT